MKRRPEDRKMVITVGEHRRLERIEERYNIVRQQYCVGDAPLQYTCNEETDRYLDAIIDGRKS